MTAETSSQELLLQLLSVRPQSLLDKRSLYSKQTYVFLFFDLNGFWRENDVTGLMQDAGYRTSELVQCSTPRQKEIFHCDLSQQRFYLVKQKCDNHIPRQWLPQGARKCDRFEFIHILSCRFNPVTSQLETVLDL